MHKIIHLPIEVNVNKTVELFVFFVSKDLNQSIHSRPLLTCEHSMSVSNCRQLCGIVINTNYFCPEVFLVYLQHHLPYSIPYRTSVGMIWSFVVVMETLTSEVVSCVSVMC